MRADPFLRVRRRPMLSAWTLALIGAAVLMAFYNATYWSKALDVFAGHPIRMVLFQGAIYALTVAMLAPFAWRGAIRPVLAGLLILSAVTSYYVDALGVVVDRDMIQNVATTTFAESKHLLTPRFVGHVLLWGILPAASVFLVRVRRAGRLATLGVPVVLLVLGVGGAVLLLMTDYGAYAAILRERKDLMQAFQPGAPLVGAVRYARMAARSAAVAATPVGTDARKGAAYGQGRPPVVLVIVVGETARARDFALNGYGRPTTPELEARAVVSFTDMRSCGTATAVSLPCMVSPLAREDYTYDKGRASETLLDVLAHAGFAVEWWDNNTGDKGVAARVPQRRMTAEDDAAACASGACTDGVFDRPLAAFLDGVERDTVLVLHQIGSHGPAYHLRYPEGFGPFRPACETAEFADCTPDQILNAYDNTIAWTDHVLAQTIDRLAAARGLDAAMLYVSDHGESLGENGLYLHGAPWFMAPEDQTRIPMILWMSDRFRARMGLNGACLAARAAGPASHDNLFHSVLGMLDVETGARDAALDLFDGCDGAGAEG